MSEKRLSEKLVPLALVALVGSVACSASEQNTAPSTNGLVPTVGYLLPGRQMNFYTNGDVGIIRFDGLTGSEKETSYELLSCQDGDLLTDTSPTNHNDSDIRRERASVTVTYHDPKCNDNALTPQDYNLA